MQLSVACNFDKKLIDQIKGYPVHEVFGKLSEDFLGGGRSTYMLPSVRRREFMDYVAYVKKNGIGFSYLLNAPCFNNQEFTKRGQRKINEILGWLDDIGIHSVTVSSPFLLQIIKKRHPHFRVRISVFACVDSPLKVAHWEELGADCITLDSLLVNRDFETLKCIRQFSRIDLQIMVNNSCMLSCPMCHYHNAMLGHSSQAGHKNRGFVTDVCILRCSYLKLLNPVEYLRTEWVRPEDIQRYQAIGYDNFKVVERGTPTDVLVKRVKAYSEGSYDGNLLDLVQPYGYATASKAHEANKHKLFSPLWLLLHPSLVNPLKLLPVKRLAERRGLISTGASGTPPVYIDNKALDGFIDAFANESCRHKSCRACGHCHRYAAKVVQIDPKFREDCLRMYDRVFESIYSGDLWNQKSENSKGRRRLPLVVEEKT